MKINNSKDVNSLIFTHKGKDVKFRCEKHAIPMDFQDIEPIVEACIEFGDMHEVDYLIEMLERFKEAIENDIGAWKMKW